LSKKRERELQRCADSINASIEKYNRAQHRKEKEKLEKLRAFENKRE